MIDETKGIIRIEKETEKISNDEGIVVEMENGKLNLYRDYNKLDKKKYPRLTR